MEDLLRDVQKFCEERDWDQFHGPKDLAIGLVTEASELLELFRFLADEEALQRLQNSDSFKEQVSDELADVLFFLLRFAERQNINLQEALYQKLNKNQKKYPIEKAKGSNKKYTEL